eukprot:Gregarina_sp_Poly_1__7591@NODE_425_length_8620_cov_281_527534_g346_i0_p1_GENE_NODE_425_length_8620_cov_281_527534_g346_i0NODE_425_length_8620_cov_281_527534_g346_i0_p1_ORF_typecomplete_len534_score47_92Ecm33/PF12454_8/3_3Ecm33/PF12454_8/3_5e02_NODE_425_length_8620_cov_281_527534_g346_i028554456
MALKLLARIEGLCFMVGTYCGLLSSPSLAFASPQREVGPPPSFPLLNRYRRGDRLSTSPNSDINRPPRYFNPEAISATEAGSVAVMNTNQQPTSISDDVDDDEEDYYLDNDSLDSLFEVVPRSFRYRQEKLRVATAEAVARLKAYTDHREPLPDLECLAPAVAAAVLVLGQRKACGGSVRTTPPICRAMAEYATYCTGTTATLFKARLEAFRETWRATFHLAAASGVPYLSITGMPWSARAVSATYLGTASDPHGTLGDASYLLMRSGRIVKLMEEPEHYIGCLAYTAFQQSGFLDVLAETALNHYLQLESVGIVPCPNILFEEWILPRLAALQSTASQRERFGSLHDPLHLILGIGEESVRGLSVGEVFVPQRPAHRLVDLVRAKRLDCYAQDSRGGRTLYRMRFPSPAHLGPSDAYIQSSDHAGWAFQHSGRSKVYSVHTNLAEPDLSTLHSVLIHHVLRELKGALVELFIRVFLRGLLRVSEDHRDQFGGGSQGGIRMRPTTPSTQVPGDTISDRSSVEDVGFPDDYLLE